MENRSWRTSYRGRILIHASVRPWAGPIPPVLGPIPPDLALGAVVGSVEVVDCLPVGEADDPLAFGPWCWILRDPHQAAPISARGKLGLWEWTPCHHLE